MMRVRYRSVRGRRGLTRGERSYLLSGRLSSDIHGVAPFSWRDRDGVWQADLAEAEAAWREHRDGLIEDAASRGLIPLAGREFDGMPGDVHPYEHLRRTIEADPTWLDHGDSDSGPHVAKGGSRDDDDG